MAQCPFFHAILPCYPEKLPARWGGHPFFTETPREGTKILRRLRGGGMLLLLALFLKTTTHPFQEILNSPLKGSQFLEVVWWEYQISVNQRKQWLCDSVTFLSFVLFVMSNTKLGINSLIVLHVIIKTILLFIWLCVFKRKMSVCVLHTVSRNVLCDFF